MLYLETHQFISPDQSAFLKHHSTVTALHKVTDNLLNNIDEGLITCVCFFDIAKCFDSLDHSILLSKLDKYGIRNNTLLWFKSYLSDRTQATFVHNSLSPFLPISTGVPQGSILGPTLFLLFINDLPKYVKCCNLYADDCMVGCSGNTVPDILVNLQSEVNKLSNWFKANKLSVSLTKSCSMLIGCQQRLKEYVGLDTLGITLNNSPLCNKSSYTYLGLELDSTLSWDNAAANVQKKLSSRLAMLQRLSNSMPNVCLRNMYFAFIQPHIGYCLSVYGHTSKSNLNKIQRFQNHAARIVSHNYDYNISGDVIVTNLGWQNVSQRRDFLTSILLCKCMNGLAPDYLCDSFISVNDVHNRVTRQSVDNVLYIPTARTSYMQKSFQYYGASIWNNIPSFIRNANSLTHFKILYKRHYFTHNVI